MFQPRNLLCPLADLLIQFKSQNDHTSLTCAWHASTGFAKVVIFAKMVLIALDMTNIGIEIDKFILGYFTYLI